MKLLSFNWKRFVLCIALTLAMSSAVASLAIAEGSNGQGGQPGTSQSSYGWNPYSIGPTLIVLDVIY